MTMVRVRRTAKQRRLIVALAMVALPLSAWSVKLVRLNGAVEALGEYWATPRGQIGGLLYVALGDSSAQGIGASRPERGYVGLVAQHVRESTGQPVLVINLSRSGARIDDVLDRQLPALRGLRPDWSRWPSGGTTSACTTR